MPWVFILFSTHCNDIYLTIGYTIAHTVVLIHSSSVSRSAFTGRLATVRPKGSLILRQFLHYFVKYTANNTSTVRFITMLTNTSNIKLFYVYRIFENELASEC